MKHQHTSSEARYAGEREFFDREAASARVAPMSEATLERYAHPRNPHLFSNEFMFSLLGDAHGKTVLEIGCGEGVASVQLAYAGARVTALDISPQSIEVARKRALVQGVRVDFRTANIETDTVEEDYYDAVWCDAVLHHVVPSLDTVMARIRASLKPGGLFIAREPIAYARWLKAIRRLVSLSTPATPDETPLRPSEFRVIEKHFPVLNRRYSNILARLHRVFRNMWVVASIARLDNLLLCVPGTTALAGTVVVWAKK